MPISTRLSRLGGFVAKEREKKAKDKEKRNRSSTLFAKDAGKEDDNQSNKSHEDYDNVTVPVSLLHVYLPHGGIPTPVALKTVTSDPEQPRKSQRDLKSLDRKVDGNHIAKYVLQKLHFKWKIKEQGSLDNTIRIDPTQVGVGEVRYNGPGILRTQRVFIRIQKTADGHRWMNEYDNQQIWPIQEPVSGATPRRGGEARS